MNLDGIEALVRLVSQAGVEEVQVGGEGWRVAVRKNGAAAPAPAPTAAPTAEPETAECAAVLGVTAPLVGRFRPAESPVGAGSHVEAGQVLGRIESMGILTPVTAACAGEVTEVLAEPGQPVEYGQELFRLSPAREAAAAGGEQ